MERAGSPLGAAPALLPEPGVLPAAAPLLPAPAALLRLTTTSDPDGSLCAPAGPFRRGRFRYALRMNPVIEALHAHRSVRRYKPGEVPQADIEEAVRAGQSAATSSAVQSYCCIRVTNADVRTKLIELTGGQQKVADAGAFLVICGDTRRHRLIVQRAGRPYDARLEAFLLAVVDATLFAQNTVVAFESMGYGTCYIGGLRNQLPEADKLLGTPHGVYPLFGLCVGVPDETPSERPRLPLEAVLFDDKYPDDGAMLGLIDAYDERYRAYLRERGVGADQLGAAWSGPMIEKFSEPRRTHLAGHYTEKGAGLD